MAAFKSDFLRIVHERGMVHQCSDAARLDELLSSGVRTAYIGFDCTADSLHIGHLLQIMLLRWWQKTGHKPITLMGGGTTKVGDPSGRDETRQLLTPAQIDANMASIKTSFANYLSFGSGKTDAVMANNADWLDTLLYIPLLRDVGRHFSVNRMLTMDSVRLRLERDQPLSFLAFNYMILQSYDFVELYKRHDCILQMGGSARWGNIATVSVPRAQLAAGGPALGLFHRAGLAESRSEARKLIKGGGGRLNDKPIASDTTAIKDSDLGSDGTLKLSAGRKRHVLVRAA